MGVREDALDNMAFEEREYRCRSIEEAEVHITSLTNNQRAQEARIRYMEDLFDTFFDSPIWKRTLFWWVGWPMDRITNRPNERWWRRLRMRFW